MIATQNLRKTFGQLAAVDDVSLTVGEGEIYGLLGPNGAGKTTTVNMICGLLTPSGGSVRVGGKDISTQRSEAARLMGIVPQETAIYDELTARENVTFALGCYGIAGTQAKERARQALELVGLEWNDRRPAKKFSGGMKRRLNLAMGIAHGPRVLLLDEPTVGIDPQARLNILDVVRGLAGDGRAVLYTTHYLEEAEMLCHRVGILDHGRLLAEGTVEELRALVGEGKVATLRGDFDADEISSTVAARDDVETVSLQDGVALLSVGAGGLPRLLETLLQRGVAVDDLSIQEASLQQVFLKLTGRELRD
jgi:ABC-2 type transport system ATP-binding protein